MTKKRKQPQASNAEELDRFNYDVSGSSCLVMLDSTKASPWGLSSRFILSMWLYSWVAHVTLVGPPHTGSQSLVTPSHPLGSRWQ